MDTNMDKMVIRRFMLKERNLLAEVLRNSASEKIFKRIDQMDLTVKAGFVFCYVSTGSEVISWTFIDKCLNKGIRVAVPKIVKDNEGVKRMIASEIYSFDELVKGYFGILETAGQCVRPQKADEMDVVITPGLAFDTDLNRLGYGRGFYDVFFTQARPDCRKIGVAFDFQVLDCIPADQYDIRLDMVVTEKRIISRKD